MANLVSPAIEWISSLTMMLCRCVSTVRTLIRSRSATSALLRPLGDQLEHLPLAAAEPAQLGRGRRPAAGAGDRVGGPGDGGG